MHCRDAAVVVDGHIYAAQQVGDEIGDGIVAQPQGHALAVETVIVDSGGCAAGDGGLGIAVKGDGVRDGGGPVYGTARALQHAVALAVVQETVAGCRASRRGPVDELALDIIAHGRAGWIAATACMRAGCIGVLAGHVASGVIGGVLVRHVAQVGHGVDVARVAIGIRAFAPAGHAIQVVIAVRLVMIGDGGSRRRGAAVVAAGGRAIVAVPHQPAQIIVTIRLIVVLGAAAGRRDGGEQLRHVADIVIGARLAKERLRLSSHGGAGGERTLDGVIAQAGAEKRIGGRGGFGAGAAHRQAGDLAPGSIADLPHQEVDRIRATRRAEVDRLRAPVSVVLRGERLTIGIR